MNKRQNQDFKVLKQFLFKESSLLRYIFLFIFDLSIWLIKIAFSFLFPYVVMMLTATILVVLKMEPVFNENIAWGLTGGGLGFLGIAVAILSIVRGINKEYFKINSLKIFGSYKLFGLYKYYLLWAGAGFFGIFSIITTILKDKSSYMCSISEIIYTLFIVFVYVYIFFKNDDKKYLKYLKNAGVLKIKKRSLKMSQSVFFCSKHKKIDKLFEVQWVVVNIDQYSFHDNIKKYFNDLYLSKDGALINNVKLLKIYFENFSKYLSSDIDLIMITNLIDSINTNLISKLKAEKLYDIIKDILESMLTLSGEILSSDYFREVFDNRINIPEEKYVINYKKYAKLLGDYVDWLNIRIHLFKKMFDTVVDSFELVTTIKANNYIINNIKKKILPLFKKYKTEFNEKYNKKTSAD